jgi:hypothetical protein
MLIQFVLMLERLYNTESLFINAETLFINAETFCTNAETYVKLLRRPPLLC